MKVLKLTKSQERIIGISHKKQGLRFLVLTNFEKENTSNNILDEIREDIRGNISDMEIINQKIISNNQKNRNKKQILIQLVENH